MNTTTDYANGTSLTMRMPWGVYMGGRAMCSDGVVRTLSRISITADTFFSVPAAVKVKGKTVSGFITVDTLNDSGSVVKFIAISGRKNSALLA